MNKRIINLSRKIPIWETARSDKMKYIKNFLKGMAVGIGTLVPGVSGGTIAIILGIYDEMIHAVSSFFENWKKHAIFLLTVGAGGLFGMLLFSRLLESAINNYPYVMRYLFMGAIIGGLPVLYRKSLPTRKRTITDYFFLILGFVIVLFLSKEAGVADGMASDQGWLSLVYLFIAGIVIAIALVLPGISGSFVLLIMGLHTLTLNAINTVNIAFLIPLALGTAAGILGTTKIIENFLNKYPDKTYLFIIGLVIGSIVSVFPGIPAGAQFLPSLLAMAAGIAILLFLGKRGIVE